MLSSVAFPYVSLCSDETYQRTGIMRIIINLINWKRPYLLHPHQHPLISAISYASHVYLTPQEPTIGAAFLTQAVVLDDATVKFEIWDTGKKVEEDETGISSQPL